MQTKISHNGIDSNVDTLIPRRTGGENVKWHSLLRKPAVSQNKSLQDMPVPVGVTQMSMAMLSHRSKV